MLWQQKYFSSDPFRISIGSSKLGQQCTINPDGTEVCPIKPAQPALPTVMDTPVPTTAASTPEKESTGPIIPIAIGAAALIVAALLMNK